MKNSFTDYADRLSTILKDYDWEPVSVLAGAMARIWERGDQLFLCGNGGSAGNAIHLANDFLYGVGGGKKPGLKVEALTSNPAVITCLANDVGYDGIFAEQLKAKGACNDVLLILSGSGNSPNVVRALEVGNHIGMQTFAIVGYSGGKCMELASEVIHFPVDDMQISEDLQLVVGHMCMQWLLESKKIS